ncbi:sensor domain-containing diguanylate cyclase [Lysobacter arvi]|uniref:diguanylate cyclase n=1 Tax=Lysobacter arvi TaxID=3038776 RepID=A0ABU1CI94_9GAMM|nr:GGDEF domain-containing protein [Lysobacter arvi]MDR0184678.1 GGDEF domain-containing protein [Lysobacter arvi]
MIVLRNLSPLRVFLAATVILVSLGLYVVANAIQFASDYRAVTHTYTVLQHLDRIESLKHQVVAESRGYLLAGRAENRDSFWRIGGALQREADVLAEHVIDNDAQHGRAVALRRALDARLRLSVQAMQSWRAGATMPGDAPLLMAIRHGDRDIAMRLEHLRSAENALLSTRSRRAERSAWLTLLAAGIGIPLSLLLIGHAQRRLARENRVRRQAEAAASDSNAELNATVQQLARLSDSMAALSQYSSMLQGASDAQELYEITASTFRRLLPGLGGLLYVIRASRDHAELVAQWGGAVAPNDPAPALQACWSVRRHAPFAMDDLRHGLRCSHIGRPHGAEDVHGLCVPLSAHGEVVGWLSLQGEGRGRIPDESLAIRLCEQLSLALANVRLRESLRHQAVRDPLTGLFNRRYLEESLAREIARCQRRAQPLAVLMLDVDHFKSFNDRHGHAMGDAALSAFARMLKTRCRPEDIACRYGGEEFTLILPETDLATALERAEDIRAGAAMLRIGDAGDAMLRITVSIGVALMPEHGEVGLELMRAGDRALYRAKHEGRDRVAVADVPVAVGEPMREVY